MLGLCCRLERRGSGGTSDNGSTSDGGCCDSESVSNVTRSLKWSIIMLSDRSAILEFDKEDRASRF